MIAVTGAAGFIGRNLVERLRAEGEEVVTVDLVGSHMNPFDFLDFLTLEGRQFSTIFHQGACSDTTASDADYVMRHNTEYTILLSRICIQQNIKLIYASSASVYGDGPFREGWRPEPKNLYALSKSIFDLYASAFESKTSLLTGLRYFNVYGKYEENKGHMSSVIYKFHDQMSTGKIQLFENSQTYLRDFIHVDDVIETNLFFYRNPNYSGIYNVGTGNVRSFQDIADIFVERYSTEIEYIPMPAKLLGRYQGFTQSDNTKISSIFSHSYKTLEEGVEDTLKYLEALP